MIVVTNNNDSGAGSLRQAILDAAVGEEITFSVVGVITLTGGGFVIAQDLIITGPGSGQLALNGTGNYRIFETSTGIISISGMTLADGAGSQGPGIHNEATLTLSDVVIAECVSDDDGAGLWNSSTVIGTNVYFDDNIASNGNGGGIWNSGTITGSFLVHACVCSNDGGGIYNSGTFTHNGGYVRNCISNGVTGGGGVYNSGTYTPTDISISNNTSHGNGHGLLNTFGTVNFTRCTIGPHASIGAYNSAGTFTFDNSTISGNAGTGIYNAVGAMDIKHSTITQNLYGLTQDSGSFLDIFDTILSGNTAGDYDGDTADVISGGHNIFGNDTNPVTPATGDQIVLSFAALVMGPLQDNGGPTFTHALLPGSPAIDAGDSTAAPATDQRGEPRVQDGTIDIGAYESTGSPDVPCLTFTGELPSWITINEAQSCLVGAAGTFRAATKEAANAMAQAALQAFFDEQQDLGNLVCQTNVLCQASSPFTTEYHDLEITGPSESPNRGPGYFNQTVTFDATAGEPFSVYMRSADFDTFVYVNDPSTTMVGSDDSHGYHKTGDMDNACLLITPLVTGTYSIDCTTFSPGETGTFELVISAGAVAEGNAGTGGINFAQDVILVPNHQKVFMFNQSGNSTTDLQVICFDACSMDILLQATMPGGFGYNPVAVAYNPDLDIVYVVNTDQRLYAMDPTTFVFTPITSNLFNAITNGCGIAYDSNAGKIFAGVEAAATPGTPIANTGIYVFDSTSNAQIDFIITAATPRQMIAADDGFIYVTSSADTFYKVNTTTHAVTPIAISIVSANYISWLTELGLIGHSTDNSTYSFFEVASGTVLANTVPVSKAFGSVYNPNAIRIVISTLGESGLERNLIYYDPVGHVVDRVIRADETLQGVYFDGSQCVYWPQSEDNIMNKYGDDP